MDADAVFDPLVSRHAGVAGAHAGLRLDGAAHRVDHAPELDDRAVAGALDDATVMHRNDRVDEIATKGSQAREDAVLVGSRE
jgi:hypothetical protein